MHFKRQNLILSLFLALLLLMLGQYDIHSVFHNENVNSLYRAVTKDSQEIKYNVEEKSGIYSKSVNSYHTVVEDSHQIKSNGEKDFHLFQKVIISKPDSCPEKGCSIPVAHIQDDGQNVCKDFSIQVSRYDSYNQWKICPSANMTSRCPHVYDVGILPRKVYYIGNIGHFMFDNLGNIISFKEVIDQHLSQVSASNSQRKFYLILPPIFLHKKVRKLIEFFHALNFTDVLLLDSMTAKSLCFNEVYLPTHSRDIWLNKESIKLFRNYFGASTSHCRTKGQFTILQRDGERRFEYITDIVRMVESHGFKNVKVVSFENKTMKEQMQVAVCSTVFMGVQGAGMTWAHFLPSKAILIEIGMPMWRNNEYSSHIKQAGRDDIRTFSINCDAVISDDLWAKYARKYAIPDNPMDTKAKYAILEKDKHNKERKYGDVIQKHSNCLCLPKHLKKVLKKIKYVTHVNIL